MGGSRSPPAPQHLQLQRGASRPRRGATTPIPGPRSLSSCRPSRPPRAPRFVASHEFQQRMPMIYSPALRAAAHPEQGSAWRQRLAVPDPGWTLQPHLCSQSTSEAGPKLTGAGPAPSQTALIPAGDGPGEGGGGALTPAALLTAAPSLCPSAAQSRRSTAARTAPQKPAALPPGGSRPSELCPEPPGGHAALRRVGMRLGRIRRCAERTGEVTLPRVFLRAESSDPPPRDKPFST